MYSKNKFIPPIVLLLVTSLLFVSCKILDTDSSEIDSSKLPLWTVSVNQIVKYPRATAGEKEVPSFDGRTIWVRRHYEINSKSIENITPVPVEGEKGYYDLKLKLNRHGSLVGMRLCNDTAHPPWAFLVDGVYNRSVRFVPANNDDNYTEIIVKGPFDKILANKLEKYSEPNYNHLHPNDD